MPVEGSCYVPQLKLKHSKRNFSRKMRLTTDHLDFIDEDQNATNRTKRFDIIRVKEYLNKQTDKEFLERQSNNQFFTFSTEI